MRLMLDSRSIARRTVSGEAPIKTRIRRNGSRINVFQFTTLAVACIVTYAFVANAAESPPMQPAQQPSHAPASMPNSLRDTSQLLQDIKDAIGDAACDSDAQCQTIGIGVKPCGGAETFLGWSSKNTDRAALTTLVSRHRDARQSENERSGAVSDCRVIPDPGAVCRPRASDGVRVCQLVQGAKGRQD
jgi:hypothetical protein